MTDPAPRPAGRAALLAAAPARAQAWPARPVRLVVGFTAGSSTDITGRIFAQAFSQAWGQPVVVENIPARAAPSASTASPIPPDGYTLMWAGNGAITIVPTLQAGRLRPAARPGQHLRDARHGLGLHRRQDRRSVPWPTSSPRRRRSPAGSPTARPASARRSTSRSRCCPARPASAWSTSPIAAPTWPMS